METRARLVRAAAEIFNRDGYEGTDTNKIARYAGYAPGTFYKHFEDKRAIFVAVYRDWLSREWVEIERAIEKADTTIARAEHIVDVLLAHHRAWYGVRASLHALVRSDPVVRAVYRAERVRQFEALGAWSGRFGAPFATREADALLLFTTERTADAFASGELEALGLDAGRMRERLVEAVRQRLGE